MFISKRYQKIRQTEEDFDDFANSLIELQKKIESIENFKNFKKEIIEELRENFNLNPSSPEIIEEEYKCKKDNILSISPFLVSVVAEELGKVISEKHEEMFPYGIYMISRDHRHSDFYMIKNWDDLMNWQWTVVDGTEDYYSVPYINDIHPEWGSQDGYVSYGSFESLIVILYLLSNMKDMESFFEYCFKKLEVN